MATAYAVETQAEGWEYDGGDEHWQEQEEEYEQEGDENRLNGNIVQIRDLKGEDVWAAPPAGHSGEDYKAYKADNSNLDGKIGRARYMGDEIYIVDLLDGDSFWIPGKFLEEFEQPLAEDGGFDVAWPDLETGNLTFFGLKTAEALQMKGFCIIKTFNSDEARDALVAMANGRVDWGQPPDDFKEAYLGRGSPSSTSLITEEIPAENAGHVYVQSLKDLASVLAPFSGDGLDFTISPTPRDVMFRKGANKWTSYNVNVEGDRMEQLIEFMQYQRLCVMNMVTCENGATMEFIPLHKDSGLDRITISLAAGQMVVFRNDWYAYSYVPEGPDLVVQGWLMQMPPTLAVNRIEGSSRDVMSVIGVEGRDLISSNEINIMSLSGYIAGSTFGFQQTRLFYMGECDGVVPIPQSRWNHDLYYDEDYSKGLAVCRHTGFIEDNNFFGFSPELFGMTMEDAHCLPTSAMKFLETAHDMLHQVGKTKENMRGERYYWTIGDAGRDTGLDERSRKAIHSDVFQSNHLNAQILQHHFGTHGMAQLVDTACSASMTAFNLVFQEIKSGRDRKKGWSLSGYEDYEQGSVGGSTFANDPMPYIGMSQAHMLGKLGRSVTFDMSANGFIRGEAFINLYMRRSQGEQDALNHLITAVGGATNQDGRSASLTAPNGPSQSYCVRIAQRDINRHPFELCITELHGTGTALGDPIETGSTRALSVTPTSVRATPLFHTAGKSGTGHTELAAGANGLIRTTISLYGGTCVPNVHIRELNQNIEYHGYPAIFPSEAVDCGEESLSAGVNSFGFGGTNSRAELWATVKSGPRKRAQMAVTPAGRAIVSLQAMPVTNYSHCFANVVGRSPIRDEPLVEPRHMVDTEKVQRVLVQCPKCGGQMCWLCKEAIKDDEEHEHRCSQVREAGADYSVCSLCYEGDYLLGKPEEEIVEPGGQIFILASWINGHGTPVVMKQMQSEDGNLKFTHKFALGTNRKPSFWLSIRTEAGERQIFPIKDGADQGVRVSLGPLNDTDKPNRWMIDTEADGAPLEGAVYEITFHWSSRKKSISWIRHESTMQALGSGASLSDATEEPAPASTDEEMLTSGEDWTADGWAADGWTADGWTADGYEWTQDDPNAADGSAVVQDRTEYFSICVSGQGWFPALMSWSEYGDANGDDTNLWEASVRIGQTGRSEFYFLRNEDPTEAIFPADADMPVGKGAENVHHLYLTQGSGATIETNKPNVAKQAWVVQGRAGSYAVVQLRMVNHRVMVRIFDDALGERVWEGSY